MLVEKKLFTNTNDELRVLLLSQKHRVGLQVDEKPGVMCFTINGHITSVENFVKDLRKKK